MEEGLPGGRRRLGDWHRRLRRWRRRRFFVVAERQSDDRNPVFRWYDRDDYGRDHFGRYDFLGHYGSDGIESNDR